MLSPGANYPVEILTKGIGKATKDLVNQLPETVLTQQVLGSHLPPSMQRKPSKTYPYQASGYGPWLRWLLSTGLVPRETDPGALARSYGFEHKKKP